MQGWSTGNRHRHTLAGVPTRPTVKRCHVRADMLKKAKSRKPFLYGRGCCACCAGRPSPNHAYGRDSEILAEIIFFTHFYNPLASRVQESHERVGNEVLLFFD